MTLDMVHFTPWAALAGGALIGAAAGLLILGAGRIAGISGIVGHVLPHPGAEGGWRLCFILGLALAPWLAKGLGWEVGAAGPRGIGITLVAAGLLVGFGTRLGSGCTSGHGVCGLARLSRRSLAAALTFVVAGMATVWVVRHVIGAN